MEVFYESRLSGRDGVCEVEADGTVLTLKQRILSHDDSAVDEEDCSLQHDGRLLEDVTLPLSALDLEHGALIELVLTNARCLRLLRGRCRNLVEMPDYARNDKSFVCAALSVSSSQFEHVSEALRDDRDVVLAAAQSPSVLRTASARLRDDKEVVLRCVSSSGNVAHASERLRGDGEVAIHAAADASFRHVSEELRNDPAFMLGAVRREAFSLQYATAAVCDNGEVAALAVAARGDALRHVSARLRDNETLVRAAVEAGRGAQPLQHASNRLRENAALALRQVELNARYVQHMVDEERNALLEDEAWVAKAVWAQPCSLQWLQPRWRGCPTVVKMAVKRAGLALEWAGEAAKSDKEVVLAAVSHRGTALKYAGASMRKDRDVLLAAVRSEKQAFLFAPEELRGLDRELAEAAVAHDGAMLYYAAPFLDDEPLVRAAVATNPAVLRRVSERLRRVRGVALAAASGDGTQLRFVSDELRDDAAFVEEVARAQASLRAALATLPHASERLQSEEFQDPLRAALAEAFEKAEEEKPSS